MRKAVTVSVITLVVVFTAMASFAVATGDEDKVAMVNGVAISQQELDNSVTMINRYMQSMGRQQNAEQMEQIRETVLNSLIQQELIYQQSQKDGFTVSEQEITDRFEEEKAKFESEEQFNVALQAQNMSADDFREKLMKTISVRNYIDEKFIKTTEVTDMEAKIYYSQHEDSFHSPASVRASHILIQVKKSDSEEDKGKARKELEDIRARIDQGEDFAALAKEYSACPSKEKGGDLGYFGRGQMVKSFEDAAFAMEKGAVSDIVETPFGLHLIKVVDKKEEMTTEFPEVKEKIKESLAKGKINEKIMTFVQKLMKDAKIERFAGNNS